MIPVALRPEPVFFDAKVRQRGMNWLQENGIDLDHPLPKGTTIPPFWRECLEDLWRAYQGVCAYSAFYFELHSGAASTDHFVAKSKQPRLAYDWANFRLACNLANSQKGVSEGLLDPFELEPSTFILDLDSGEITVNPDHSPALQAKAWETIKALELDSPRLNEMRAAYWKHYAVDGFPEKFLQKFNPFVYAEALRQDRL